MMGKGKFAIGVPGIIAGLFLAAALFACMPVYKAEALIAGNVVVPQDSKSVQVGTAPRYLADGTYVFDVDKDKSLVVDVVGSSKKAGALLAFASDSASTSQQWRIAWDDKYRGYRIKNVKSGLYLTTKAATAGKKMVSQMKYSATSKNQLWRLEKAGAGYRIVSCANSSIGLGTWSGKIKSGYDVTTQRAASKKFKFYLLPVDDNLMKPKKAAPESLDGTFARIASATKSSLRIDVAGNETATSDSAVFSKASDSQSQKWYLKAIDAEEGVYAILNLGSGKALQVAGKGRHVGTYVGQGAMKTSSKFQQWWVREDSAGRFTFTSCYNGLVLQSEKAGSGVNLSLGLKSGANHQFKLVRTKPLNSNAYYYISTAKNASLSMGVSGGSTSQNKRLQVNTYKGTQLWQKFKVESVPGGFYAIRSVSSNRYVGEVDGKIVQGTRSLDASQQWAISWAGSGFVLKNAQTGHVLSLPSSVKNGANLIASKSNKASLARFIFTQCHLIDNGTYFLTKGSNANKVMGIDQTTAKKENAKIGVFKKADVQSLKFNVSYAGKDSSGNEIYKLENTYSGKYLTASGSKLVQKERSSSKAQCWKAVVTSAGCLAFQNVSSGKAMSFGSKNMSAAKYDAKGSSFRLGFIATTSLTPEQLRAYEMVAATYSKTNYAITVDYTNHRVRIWKRASAKDPWTLRNDWICSNGKRSTPSPVTNKLLTGYRKFKSKPFRADGSTRYSSFYYMTYLDAGCWMHTPLYRLNSMTRYADKRMGRSISNGCVRIETPNAIWVYKNIKRGTRLITYN